MNGVYHSHSNPGPGERKSLPALGFRLVVPIGTGVAANRAPATAVRQRSFLLREVTETFSLFSYLA